MNVELLRTIQMVILTEPNQFVMLSYYANSADLEYEDGMRSIPNCGTAACIAGWAVSIACKETPRESYKRVTAPGTIFFMEMTAQQVLGLTTEQAITLFHVYSWPEPFKVAWYKDSDPEERACIASRRIDHFISAGY